MSKLRGRTHKSLQLECLGDRVVPLAKCLRRKDLNDHVWILSPPGSHPLLRDSTLRPLPLLSFMPSPLAAAHQIGNMPSLSLLGKSKAPSNAQPWVPLGGRFSPYSLGMWKVLLLSSSHFTCQWNFGLAVFDLTAHFLHAPPRSPPFFWNTLHTGS